MKELMIAALLLAVSLPAYADKALDKEIRRTDAQMLKILQRACDKGSFVDCMIYRGMLEDMKKPARAKVQQPCPPEEIEVEHAQRIEPPAR